MATRTDTSQRSLDGRYYTDPELFEHELDTVFHRTWQMVGHVSQLAEPGDMITATIGRERVLITNDGTSITGMFNVCQHRGHQLVPTGTTNVPVIICPYHAWTYDLAGQLVRARRINASDLGGICVPKIRVDTMAGFVFVNLDQDAIPLADYAPGLDAELLRLVPDAPQRRLTSQLTHTFQANWKLAIENYNECYHCPNVHKSFTTGVIDPKTFMITPRGNNVWQTATAASETKYDLPESSTQYGAYYTWPVSSIQCYPGRVLNTFRWVPLTVDSTQLIREWWFETTEPNQEQQHIIHLDWTTTVAEDFDLMESVQHNMSSRGYTPGPLIVDLSGIADIQHENAVAHLQTLAKNALADVC